MIPVVLSSGGYSGTLRDAFTPVKVPLFARTIVTDVHLSVKFTEMAEAETDRDSLHWDVAEVARMLFTATD